jgi:uncharacterized protein
VMASGALVVALGVVMVARGANVFGFALPSLGGGAVPTLASAPVTSGVQEVRSTVEASTYHPITVRKGIPVRWIITAKPGDINGCNSPLTVPAWGIRKVLTPGENVIEFTPTEAGVIRYTCWMGMVSSTITVVDDGSPIATAFGETGSAEIPRPPTATGGRTATGARTIAVGLATRTAEGQTAVVKVTSAGYDPAVIVLQKGMKARIRFEAASLTGCNSRVVFPEYNGELDLARGQTATPWIDVSSDFTFECGMSMLHGYVKVVDDLAAVDVGAVRREVSAVLPASTTTAGSCCR